MMQDCLVLYVTLSCYAHDSLTALCWKIWAFCGCLMHASNLLVHFDIRSFGSKYYLFGGQGFVVGDAFLQFPCIFPKPILYNHAPVGLPNMMAS